MKLYNPAVIALTATTIALNANHQLYSKSDWLFALEFAGIILATLFVVLSITKQ